MKCRNIKILNNKISFSPVCMKYQSGEDSDQPPWMRRLIQIFTGPLICKYVCTLPKWSIFFLFCFFFVVVLLFFGRMYNPCFTFNHVSLSWRCK